MIELVVGAMFGGKSEYLLSKASKHKSVGKEILAFKPKRDTRSSGKLYSRIGSSIEAREVESWKDLSERVLDQNGKKTLVLIDEAQFMPPCESRTRSRTSTRHTPHAGKVDLTVTENVVVPAGRILWNLRHDCRYEVDFVVAGLLFTTEQMIFPTMASLLTVADKITHMTALCAICGEDAAFTICTIEKREDVLVGDTEIYSPRCGKHYDRGNPNWNRWATNYTK